jgi:hypothetical protein
MTEPGALLAAADAAASGGDLQTAEQLLREALARQEATLGPSHADLANTVNNLAVVCERLEKFDEAEQGYRRAHAIAVRSLGPKHPFVATSLKNLVDFCAARGIPLWAPPAAAERAPADLPPPRSDAVDAGPDRPARAPARAAAFGLIAVGALALLFFVAPWRNGGPPPAADPGPAAAEQPATAPPPAPPPPASAGSGRRVDEALDSSASVDRSPAGQPTAEAAPAAPAPAPSSTPVTVLASRVCADFERIGSPDWRCTPVGDASAPGMFTFYTRIATGTNTTVEHRWYREGRLHRTARLAVRPGGRNGYRTFSRTTVSPERAGAWTVELREADGTVLREERFVVAR